MEAYKDIIGFEKVIEHFGEWPSFHDAEVISMSFNRNHIFEPSGPSMVAKVHAFLITPEVDKNGYYKTIKHCIITFEFDTVYDLVFEDFNHQNALDGLRFENTKDIDNKPIIAVSFDSAYGVDCEFKCKLALISEIKNGKPENGVYT